MNNDYRDPDEQSRNMEKSLRRFEGKEEDTADAIVRDLAACDPVCAAEMWQWHCALCGECVGFCVYGQKVQS